MNSEMSIPNVLIANQSNEENQNTELNTVRLNPNSFANNTVNFVLPKLGHVLDHNSSLVWSVSWDDYNPARITNNQRVVLKNFSGCLNTLRRARMYVGGRLLFTNPDPAQVIHIDKISTNPDHYEEVEDVKLGGQHGFHLLEGAGGGGQEAVIKMAADCSTADLVTSANPQAAAPNNFKRVTRALGSFSTTATQNAAWEGTVLLSDLFSALKGGIQIPVALLNEDVRVEVDFETNFDEVAMVIRNTNALGGTNISIRNPLLILDYLTYEPIVEAGLRQAMAQGITIPYREVSQITKVIPAFTTANTQNDVFLGFQGKLLMKVYASVRASNQVNGALSPLARGNGRCRSLALQDMKYQLLVNDLNIFDQPVDTCSQRYNYLSMAKQFPVYVYPNSFDYNTRFSQAVGPLDKNAAEFDFGGTTNDNAVFSNVHCRDCIAGSQSYVGIDLSKYGPSGGINPANAGYRVGSTPMILQLTYNGSGNAQLPDSTAHTVDVFCESVKVLQMRNGLVETMDA